ncbi:MAG: 2-oxoglutarate dehydrogenase E1 component [Phycisphaerales bacterium]
MNPSVRAVAPAVNGWNAAYIEDQYARFQRDPASVPEDVRAFLQGFDLAMTGAPRRTQPSGPAPATTPDASDAGANPAVGPAAGPVSGELRFFVGVANLIAAYRRDGHLAAALDPFGRARTRPASLELASHGLGVADLEAPAAGHGLPPAAASSLRAALAWLEQRYCGTIGAQVQHIQDTAQRVWLQARIEAMDPRAALSREDRIEVLRNLNCAEGFETFIHRRYQGAKRFSLEGGESLIPLLERLLLAAAQSGVEEVVIGMAHRGRLNVLNNTVGKTYEQIFTEFDGSWEEDFVDGGGDVKYHRGYSGVRTLGAGKAIAVALASNPSHLEAVGPVVCGRVRAKQRLWNDTQRQRVIPLLIHGDAAVIGQGVVAEALNMSQLDGYTVGGTLHVVVNNLIGFTTDASDARSSPYCTDLALAVDAPVFHVAGHDPEAVVAVAALAMDYRQKFKRDVFIDMWCYRKYGHNETDEASFTQPLESEHIRRQPGMFKRYAGQLVEQGVLSADEMEALRKNLDTALDKAQAKARGTPADPTIDPGGKRWKGMGWDFSHAPVPTAPSPDHLREVLAALGGATIPAGFNTNPKVLKTLAERAALAQQIGAADGPVSLTHADAEMIAFGTLLLEGTAVRLSGQDCRRGTFTQRHAALRDTQTNQRFVPLNSMRAIAPLPDEAGGTKPGPDGRPTQARLCVHDSPLSEFAVMGFDYGYSLADPNMLVLWEGQFGDFANGAQTVIDQFLASAELKWERWSGLVLLLPHGYEGQGPEHSSARMERFLQLCADENMQVCYPSTAAQHFHMLRRQVRRNFRKPLIVMTPKSNLRVPTSRVDEMLTGRFHEIIDDPFFESHKAERRTVSRVLLCSGKVYHELAARRDALRRYDTAIVRVEQVYPFHADLFAEIRAKYAAKVQFSWVQEEPRNMGAFAHIDDVLRHVAGVKTLDYIGRPPSASPAVGSPYTHKAQQEAILTRAIGPLPVVVGGAGAAGHGVSTPNGAVTAPAATKGGAAKG